MVYGKYFNKGIISHYAVELMEIGDESEFVHELAWGVSSEDLDKLMLAIRTNYFPQLNEESTILVNYMPQELPTRHEDIMKRFENFLKRERIRYS